MASPAPASERDAQLLGLALLHGYVNQAQLQAAAKEDPDPSAILNFLRVAGIVDEPCLHGLEQSLEVINATSTSTAIPRKTSATRAISQRPNHRRTVGLPLLDPDSAPATGSKIFRQLTIATWKHYQNLRFVGEGGMGRIFKALDPKLKRTVALKFLRGQEPVQLNRFLFEAQAQALVEHPNICKVYEVSEWLGHHYIAMQYVNGPSLGKLAPSLSLDENLRIMQTVAEAVHAAHRRGLIHRDIKPSNIQIEKNEDGTHRPFVLDFGLARGQDSPGLTVSGLVVGTTAYMAPEQVRGEAHQIDRRTDVYGLGATLYTVFAGAPPFGNAAGVDCLRMVLDVEPPPLRETAPDLPADLETIVMKCLEKDPARRYNDALMLAEDLRRLREGEPIQARPATLAYRASRFAKRNRALVAISAVAAAGFLVLGGIAGYSRYTAAVRERYAQHFSQAAERIESLVRFAKLMPRQDIEPYLESSRQRLAQLEAEVRGEGRMAAGPGAYALGRALLSFGEVDKSLERLRVAEQRGKLSPELANALGRCYGLIYQREVEHASRMERPEERSARIREVEASWREPAVAYLLQAKGSSLEPQEYLEALIDSYGSRMDSALVKVRAASQRSPWLYEAKRLEGELLLSQATKPEHKATAKALLDQASECFAAARQIAPSDQELWVLQARVHRQYLNLFGLDQDGVSELKACREAVNTCLSIRPSDPGPLAHLAQALLSISSHRAYKVGNSEPSLLEGLDLSAQVLRKRPDDFEANHVRILLHNTLGIWHRNLGADAVGDFRNAVQAAQAALDRLPGDASLLSAASIAATSLMIHESSRGMDITASYNQAFVWSGELLRRFPDLPGSHERMAWLQIERAEFERLHGGDPRPYVAKALERIQSAAKGRPASEKYSSISGTAYLIRSQHNFAIGEDPVPDSDRSIEMYRYRLNQASPTSPDYGNLAEACLLRTETALDLGHDPAPWINEADRAIDKGMGLDGYQWLHQLKGRSEWLKARLALKQGRPARGYFLMSLAAYKNSARIGNMNPAFEGMAQVRLERACSSEREVEDIAEGIRAAELALKRNPKSAEANLLLGLLHLQRASKTGRGPGPPDQVEGLAFLDEAMRLNGNLKRRGEILVSTRNGAGL